MKNSKSFQKQPRPFKLVKYFTFTSLIVIFFGFMVLTALNISWTRKMHLKKSEDYAMVLAENLNHQIFLQFVVPVVLKYGKIQLREKDQFERMDNVVRSTLHSFKVQMVNIYNIKNTISYSFDKSLVGKINLGGQGYTKAMNGKENSMLLQMDNAWKIFLGIPKKSHLITFAPLRAQKLSTVTGPILGVIEIVQDMTEDYKTIFRFQINIVITCGIIMVVLFFLLFFVVTQGEEVIETRAMEQIKLKEELSKAKHLSTLGEMTAGISHEIRNPLGIISSSAELLKKKVSAFDQANKFPDIIIEEARRLNNIITDFLNFAKPQNPNFLSCRLEKVINKNLAFISSQIEKMGHKITLKVERNIPEISADSDMLYQAFLNILINAIQAMPKAGEIYIEISSQRDIAIISFKDTGNGVSEDNLTNVWDPFFTTKEKGTGLGLSIVKNIIEVHGGAIFIETPSQGGVLLTIELPVKQKE